MKKGIKKHPMKEQFSDYQTSKMLKKLGSNQEQTSAYYLKGKFHFNSINNRTFGESKSDIVSAYLWQQVKQWLWENHKIFFTTHSDGLEAKQFGTEIFVNEKVTKASNMSIKLFHLVWFDSPNVSEIEAIKKAVEYLYSQTAVAATPKGID